MSGMRASLPGRHAAPDAPRETFSYRPAADRNIRVVVDRVVLRGDPDFIPSDPNWLQVRLTVSNVAARTVTLGDVKQRLADGRVVNAARDSAELQKAPNFVKDAAVGAGAATAGMVAGTLLFPPLALVGGAAFLMGPLMSANRMMRTEARFTQTSLRTGALAPGTSSSGYVFFPAVTGQTGFIVFYESDGMSQSLPIVRVRS